MSQTYTNTNNGQNRNQISGRGGPGQGPGRRGRRNCRDDHRNNLIANKYAFVEKMKDGLISKLIITKTGHQPTQYKKIVYTFLVLCTEKNYQGINDVIWTGINLFETNFIPPYSDTNQWFTTHHVEIATVDPNNQLDPNTGLRPPTVTMSWQTNVFNANLRKELLSEFEWNLKIKSQEYSKFLADKKASITFIFRQYNQDQNCS